MDCTKPGRTRTCPRCRRSDREQVDEYAVLSTLTYTVVVGCTECAEGERERGRILDYIWPVAS